MDFDQLRVRKVMRELLENSGFSSDSKYITYLKGSGDYVYARLTKTEEGFAVYGNDHRLISNKGLSIDECVRFILNRFW